MGASDYMVGNAPQGASYQAPQVGAALGQMIGNIPQDYAAGDQLRRDMALRNAFPNGLPTGPDGNVDVNAIMTTMAKIGGGQYVQGLLPHLIDADISRSAASAIGGVDNSGGGNYRRPTPPPGPQTNAGPATSPNASGPGNLKATPQNAAPSQTATVRSILQAQGIPSDDVYGASKSLASQLGVSPDDPIDTKDPQVANVLGPALQRFKLMKVGQTVGPNGQPQPAQQQAQAAPAPQPQPQQPPAQKPPANAQAQAGGPPFAPGQSAPPPTPQQPPAAGGPPFARGAQPASTPVERRTGSALGEDDELRAQMDNLNQQAARVETYAAAIGKINPATATAALAKARALREEAAKIFEYIGKGDQAAYEHELSRADPTNAMKDAAASGQPSPQAAALATKQQDILATSRGKVADKYNTAGEQAEKALPMNQIAYNLANSPDFIAGAGKGFRDAVSNISQSLGLGQSASVSQVFDKIRSSTVLDGIKSMAGTGPVRVAEMKIIEQASGDRANQAESVRAVLRMQQYAYQKELAIRDVVRKHGGIIDTAAEGEIAQIMAKPLFSEQEMKDPHALGAPMVTSTARTPNGLVPGIPYGAPFRLPDGRIKYNHPQQAQQ
jgi:hypothetical protein